MNEAGVDAFGLMTGSVAMTGFWNLLYDRSGERPGLSVDSYYAMAGAGTGRDVDGRPSYSEEAYGADWSALRLEAQDLEKCSVVVPDLSLMRIGDFVVRFRDTISSRPTQIGIVVGFQGSKPTYRGDQRSFMNQVVVLSVREGFQQVTLGTWGNSTGLFGGFTDEPNKCHVRRLLKRKSVGADVAFTQAKWDIFDTTPEVFTIAINGMREHTKGGPR